MDRNHGIDRPLIGEGKFSLGKIGGRIHLEYIFESLRQIERLTGIPFRILLPYAHGLDRKAPIFAVRDFFCYMTTPSRGPSYKKRSALDYDAKKEMEEAATRYGVEAFPVAEETAVYFWCLENLLPEEIVLHVTSGQIALNLLRSVQLFWRFIRSDFASLRAKGHSVGLTPVLYRANPWLKAVSLWRTGQGAEFLLPEAKISLDPALDLLEDQKVRIVFKTGHDTRTALLVKKNPDIGWKIPVDVIRCYVALGDKEEFTPSSGRTFTIFFGEGIRYYGDGEKRKAETFEQAWNKFNRERNLLRECAGIDFTDREVLEIGCGDGCQSLFMKQGGAKKVVATDLEIGLGSPAQRRLLAQWVAGYEHPPAFSLEGTYPVFDIKGLLFLETAGEKLPFSNDTFDVVYSNQVLEHVRDPFLCLKEMVRVLRKQGVLLMRYNPYFHLIGGHGECSTDVPWSHVLMTPEEMQEYLTYTEFPERGRKAYKSLQEYFNPGRLTIAQFEKFLEQLMPLQVLYYRTEIQSHLSERITPALLDMAQKNYPKVTLRDLLTSQVTVILRKIVS